MRAHTFTRFLVAALMLGSLFLAAPDETSGAAINWTGDTAISDDRTYAGDTITVQGNLTVTGSLTLIGAELVMDCPSCGTYAIDVKDGGRVSILAGSRVHASNAGAHYLFRVWPGSALTMNDSRLEDCGWRYNGSTPIADRGLYINSSSVFISNSTLSNNNIGIIVDNSTSPFIARNNISWNDDNALLVLSGSTPLIDHNLISSNMRNAWNNFSGAVDSDSSSPVITNNTIADNMVFGIDLSTSGNPIIKYNNITGHNKRGYGQASGINSRDNNATIEWNNVSGNTNGITLSRGSSQVTGNIINDNVGDSIVIGDGYGVLDGSSSTFANNSYSGNACGICFWGRTASSYENETLETSSRAGVEEYGSPNPFSALMTNCSFSGNRCDVLLQAVFPGSNGGTLEMIDPRAANLGVSVSDPAATLKVWWNLGVSVVYENGTLPAPGACVNVTDSFGARAASLVTGGDGRTAPVLLEAYTKVGAMTSSKSPFNISASCGGRTNTTAGFALTSSLNATVILDDIPPFVEISSPANGTLTNRVNVTARGRTERGIDLRVNGMPVDTGPAGEWSVVVPLDAEGPNGIAAEVVDGGGNRAGMAVTVFRDTVAPELNLSSPSDGLLTNRTRVVVAGTVSDPSASLTLNGGNLSVGPDGAFSTEAGLVEGENILALSSRDAAGNRAGATRTVYLDTVPPLLVVLRPADGLATTQETVTVIGSAEPDCELTVNGRPVALDQGSFTAEVRLFEGVNALSLCARDQAGNENTSMLTVFRDSTAPFLELAAPLDGQLLNTTAVEVRGTSEAGAVLSLNGNPLSLAGNSFSAVLNLMEGLNTIAIEAEDALGNSVRRAVTVLVDTKPPPLTIKSPQDRSLANRTALELRGFTEPGASLTVNGIVVQVEPSGLFTCTIGLDREGANLIVARASDAANNTAGAQITVIRDTLAEYNLTSPADGDTTKEGTVLVRGWVEAGASVAIRGIPAYPAGDGTFSQPVALAYGPNLIEITITDRAGNTASEALTVTRLKPSTPAPAKGFIPGFTTAAAVAAAASAIVAAGALRRRKDEREA